MNGNQVAALFVETDGTYFDLPGVDPWDEARDARLYTGDLPVVAHPPCQLWTNMAAVNWKRYGKDKPAWYPGGDDGSCFEFALDTIKRVGGVIEHPAFSHAFKHFGIPKPTRQIEGGWMFCGSVSDNAVRLPGWYSLWVCEVWQSAYGHRARKRTWLVYCGQRPPFPLLWGRKPGTHQVGWFDRIKPTLSKREAKATPQSFRDELLLLAQHSRAPLAATG